MLPLCGSPISSYCNQVRHALLEQGMVLGRKAAA